VWNLPREYHTLQRWGGFTSYKFKSPDQAHYLGLGTTNLHTPDVFSQLETWASMIKCSPTHHPYFPLLKPPSSMNPLAMGRLVGEQTNKHAMKKNVGVSSIHGGGLVGAGSLWPTHFDNEKKCACLIHPWWWVGGCWFPVADTSCHGHDGPECQRCNMVQYKE